MIKGILFDFDGTLANTIDLIVATFEYTLQTALGFTPPKQEIINTIGLPLGDAMTILSCQPDKVTELRQVYKVFNAANHDKMIKPIAGVAELLADLKERGIKIAVVTSKKQPMLERGINCLNMTSYIDAAVSVLDTERGKPYPDPMLLACKKLGLQPEECLCVGDSPYDLQSGHAAGCTTIAVKYTMFPWQKILDEGKPDYTINKPQDLVKIIEQINFKEA